LWSSKQHGRAHLTVRQVILLPGALAPLLLDSLHQLRWCWKGAAHVIQAIHEPDSALTLASVLAGLCMMLECTRGDAMWPLINTDVVFCCCCSGFIQCVLEQQQSSWAVNYGQPHHGGGAVLRISSRRCAGCILLLLHVLQPATKRGELGMTELDLSYCFTVECEGATDVLFSKQKRQQ
jgi:hypothetical protein